MKCSKCFNRTLPILLLIFLQDLESAEDRREREAQDMEYAKELAEDDDDLI